MITTRPPHFPLLFWHENVSVSKLMLCEMKIWLPVTVHCNGFLNALFWAGATSRQRSLFSGGFMRALALQSMTYDYQGHSPWKIDFFHVSKYSVIVFSSPQNVLYLRQYPLSNPRILVLERDSCSMSLPCQKLRIHFQRTTKRKYIRPPTPTHCQGGPPGYYTYMLLL